MTQLRHAKATSPGINKTQREGALDEGAPFSLFAWRAAWGIEQIEIDALATLQPDVLRILVKEAIAPFHDETLARRVRAARDNWLRASQAIIDAQADTRSLVEANERLARLRAHIEAETTAINALRIVDVDNLVLPRIVVPEAIDNSGNAPEPLIDSEWDFVEQTEELIASKAYRDQCR